MPSASAAVALDGADGLPYRLDDLCATSPVHRVSRAWPTAWPPSLWLPWKASIAS